MKITYYSHECGKDSMPEFEGMEYNTIGIYCHGELQYLIGYDICYIPINTESVDKIWKDFQSSNDRNQLTLDKFKLYNLPIGKNECTVIADGVTYNAIAFVWEVHNHMRGLVCLPNDVEALADAQAKFDKRSENI